MRLAVLTIGSQGDIQPNIALGLGLKAAGHEVCLVTHRDYENQIRERGLEFEGIAGSPKEILAQAGQLLLESGPNFIRFMRAFRHVVEPVAWQALDDMERALRHSEAVLYSGFALPGHYLAKQLGIPAIVTLLQPLTRTRERPSMLMPVQSDLGGFFNWLTHVLFEQIFWHPLRPMLNRWFKQKGLKTTPFFGHFGRLYRGCTPQICGFSPTVYPRPADWGDHVHLTGYWFLDAEDEWQPPDDLQDFLDQDPKPICVGFGSMHSRDLEGRVRIILEALARRRQRAVFLTGWSGVVLDYLPEWVYQADSIPHSWLFPRARAAIHHGGAGTSAAASRAGVPSIVTPFFFDQLFWGRRVASLGAGPPPLGRHDISVSALAEAIERVICDDRMIQRVKAIGETIRSENGVDLAVRITESYIDPNQRNHMR
jgi:UDP:flavonoid glycosyltransferase YjiC (YdhE family)